MGFCISSLCRLVDFGVRNESASAKHDEFTLVVPSGCLGVCKCVEHALTFSGIKVHTQFVALF